MKAKKSKEPVTRRPSRANNANGYTVTIPSRADIVRADGDRAALISAIHTTFFVSREHAERLIGAGRIPDTISEQSARGKAERANLHYEFIADTGRSWQPFRAIEAR